MSSEIMQKPAVTVVVVVIIAILEAYLLFAGQSGW
jgi:hypothetical protein